MTKARVGIPFWKTGDNSLGATLAYIMFGEQYGEVVPLMPKHTVRTDLDLLILPGGTDIDSVSYGEVPGYFNSKADPQKEYFDKVYLPQYIANGTPIIGLCRGHQSLGILHGGKLIQNMSHETNKPEDPYKCVHAVQLDTMVFWNWRQFINDNKVKIQVNSRHHQVIDPEFLSPEFAVIGRHEKDGSIEMIAHKELAIIGVQFHPEDIYDYDTNIFVDNLVNRLIITRKSILKDV